MWSVNRCAAVGECCGPFWGGYRNRGNHNDVGHLTAHHEPRGPDKGPGRNRRGNNNAILLRKY